MDERHIVAIDLGSSKFAVTVAKVEGDNMQVVYFKVHNSDGIRDSKVFAPKKVANVLAAAVKEAEEELGMKIAQVVVGMPRYQVSQDAAQMTSERNPKECITEEEIRNFKEIAMDTYPLGNSQSEVLLGAVAQSFSNGEEFQLVENDIIGMASSRIEGNFKLFIGKRKPLEDIDLAFDMIGISVIRKYFTPDTTAKAVLRESEIDNGVALIDLGGGVTSVAIYYGGIMRHYASIPFGGKLITKDIKSEASIPDRLAENIKIAYGACMPDRLQNLSEKILYINSVPAKRLPVQYLSEIITARAQEIINAILYEIEKSGFADNLKSGIVITGGGANLTNYGSLIKEMSGYNVRTGYPRSTFFTSDCEGISGTGATTSIGLLLSAKGEPSINCCHSGERYGAAEVTEENVRSNGPEPAEQGDLGMDFDTIDYEEQQKKEKEKKEAEARRKKKNEEKKKMAGTIRWLDMFEGKIKEIGNGLGNLYENISNSEV